MDSQRPEIASQAGDLLISLHLDLSGHLEQEQAAVRSSLIKCAPPACKATAAFCARVNINWVWNERCQQLETLVVYCWRGSLTVLNYFRLGTLMDSIPIHLVILEHHHAENAVSGSQLPGGSWLDPPAPCHPAALPPQSTGLQRSEWSAACPFWRDSPSNAR